MQTLKGKPLTSRFLGDNGRVIVRDQVGRMKRTYEAIDS